MGIADLFKSSKEIEREKNRARRRALRDVERAADVVKDRIATLKKERDAAWTQAREYLRDGQKAAAQRCLLLRPEYGRSLADRENPPSAYCRRTAYQGRRP